MDGLEQWWDEEADRINAMSAAARNQGAVIATGDDAPPPLLHDDGSLMDEGTDNAFCPTGPGGGVDPTCSPSGERQVKGDLAKSWELKNDADGLVKDWVRDGEADLETVRMSDLAPILDLHKDRVDKYAADFERGDKFPVVQGFRRSDGKVFITIGNHRAAAWKKAGGTEIPVVFRRFTKNPD